MDVLSKQRGVFDGDIMSRIRTKEVIYHPFSSGDPGDKVIFELFIGKTRRSADYLQIQKQQLYTEEP